MLRRGLCLLSVLLAIPIAGAGDWDPPAIFVSPAEADAAETSMRLRAEVRDAGGVASVRALVQAGDREPREVALERGSDGTWSASIPRSMTGGATDLRFWLEAVDIAGNIGRSGSAEQPYLARYAPPEVATTTPVGKAAGRIAGGLLLLVIAGGGGLYLLRRERLDLEAARAEEEERFWNHVLRPLRDLDGVALHKAVRTVCEVSHVHPVRGEVRVSRGQVMHHLGHHPDFGHHAPSPGSEPTQPL